MRTTHVPAVLDNVLPVRVAAFLEAWTYVADRGGWRKLDLVSAHGASLVSP
jgi:hypothetical protein